MKQEEIEIEPRVNQGRSNPSQLKNGGHPLSHLFKAPPKEDYSTNFAKLIVVILISLVFIAGQFVGGYISNSISVISDAFHLVTDLIGFVISFVFIYISRKTPNDVMSFGYHRMEIIGALGNLFIIWALAAFLYYEATFRIIDKEFVQEPLAMLIVASAGLAVNIVMYFVLHTGGHSHGLMSQPCSHDHNHSESGTGYECCNDSLCDDEECLKMWAYEQHCHVKIGQENEVHRHKIVKRIPSFDQKAERSEIAIKISDEAEQTKKKIEKLKQKFTIHQHNQKCQPKKAAHQHNENCNHNNSQNVNNRVENQQHGHQHDHNHNHNHNHSHDHNHDHNHQNDHKHQHEQIHHQGGQSISMKAAVLHALSDVIQSIGLLISSLIIYFVGSNNGATVAEWNDWHYLDPISTYIFSTIVIVSTWPVTKNCYYLIMEATPLDIELSEIQKEFEGVQGVLDVHDLHIWELRPGKKLLVCHTFAKFGKERQVLNQLTILCRKKKIYHSTIQVEQEQYKDHHQYIKCEQDIH